MLSHDSRKGLTNLQRAAWQPAAVPLKSSGALQLKDRTLRAFQVPCLLLWIFVAQGADETCHNQYPLHKIWRQWHFGPSTIKGHGRHAALHMFALHDARSGRAPSCWCHNTTVLSTMSAQSKESTNSLLHSCLHRPKVKEKGTHNDAFDAPHYQHHWGSGSHL